MMIYAPVPHVPAEAKAKHLAGSGLFLFHVRPDGSVSSVEVIQSTGHKILDDATVEAFSRWRFKPGAAAPKVKIPVSYTGIIQNTQKINVTSNQAIKPTAPDRVITIMFATDPAVGLSLSR
jgi:TonB family protein